MSPGEVDWLNFLGVHTTGLVGDEEVKFSVLGDESAALARVDLVLSVGANFSFRNHF